MTSSNYRPTAFAPPMYPERDDIVRPVPPVRAEFTSSPQEEHLLPQAPPRMDREEQNNSTMSRQVIGQIIDTTLRRNDCSCNYNRYATKKTIGHGMLEFALLTSNAMQLRTLAAQKQRDGIWVTSLILVCLSILAQIGLAFILIVVGKGNIQNPSKQIKLEKYNNIALFLTMLISMINVIVNVFMSTTNASNYLDTESLELLKNHT